MNKIMPALFVGHGNPMNAIEKNEFSLTWEKIAKSIPTPESIVCISAHWETDGTQVTAMPKPRTIHDFGGFPKELYEVEYPARGNPELAKEIIHSLLEYNIVADTSWGLDHGCWSVIRCMYPEADIPIIQLSLNYNEDALYHYHLGKELGFLREKNILVIGSGNIVHNLGLVDWNHQSGYEWAQNAHNTINNLILDNNFDPLIDYKNLGKEVRSAIPTPEHYLPLLYILAMKQEGEKITFFNDKLVMGSLSMTSFVIT